jgi:hypothetical protein
MHGEVRNDMTGVKTKRLPLLDVMKITNGDRTAIGSRSLAVAALPGSVRGLVDAVKYERVTIHAPLGTLFGSRGIRSDNQPDRRKLWRALRKVIFCQQR